MTIQIRELAEGVAHMADGRRVLVGCHSLRQLDHDMHEAARTAGAVGLDIPGRMFWSRQNRRITDDKTRGLMQFVVIERLGSYDWLRGVGWHAANDVALSIDWLRAHMRARA